MTNSQLNYEQAIAAKHLDGPMLVLAGPGSGKTHLLVERIRIMIEEKSVAPDSILVITFSKKSALEMQNRFNLRVEKKPYPVTFGTFHAVFYDILKHYNNYSKESILTEKQKIQIIDHGDGSGGKNQIANCDTEQLQTVADNISAYKNFGEEFFTKSAGKYMTIEEQDEFCDVFGKYCDRCRQLGKLDFDDMVLQVRELFMKHESILRQWQKKYRYFLVDEFQDINDAQYDVLRLLAGDEMNVFAVGDDDQSIYAFRGAKPSLMQKFLHQYHGCKRVNLTMNYRCCEKVIRCADNCIRHNEDRLDRLMQHHLPGKSGGIVEVHTEKNTVSQAEYVCEMIEKITREGGYSYDDIAILYRSEHCVTMLRNVMRTMNLPVKSGDSGINPYTSDVAKVITAYFKAAIDECGRRDFLLLMNTPKRGLSREALSSCDDGKSHKTEDYLSLLREYYRSKPDMLCRVEELSELIAKIRCGCVTEAFDYVADIAQFKISGPDCEKNMTESPSRCLAFLRELALDFESIKDYVIFIDKMNCDKPGEEYNRNIIRRENNCGVNLMTAHASKGLEFKVVFIIGLQEGLFPHHKSMQGELVEEERRLMYVAMTRAKERLYLCGLGTEHGKRISRFVGEI